MTEKFKVFLDRLEGLEAGLNKTSSALTIVVTAGKALLDLLK